MRGFELSEWIEQDTATVFDFLTDADNAPKLMPQVRQMARLTDGPVRAGTRYRETRVMHGKEAHADLEVSRFEPPQDYSVCNLTAGIETHYHYTCVPERGGTRVRLRCELNATGVRKLLLPVVAWVLRKEDGQHLQKLKSAVERP